MQKAIDFTEGSIRKNIILFAIPLFIGNLFQQFYNAADSIIVGNFIGQEALASVSSSDPLTNLLIGFLNGMAIGAGVVIARAKGEGNSEKIRKAIHTDIALALLSGLLLSIASFIFTPYILRAMRTPQNIMEGSVRYFRIYSAGIIFTLLYNVMMGIMNALGDSRHPLYYLIFSSTLNVLLDLVFVGLFHFGVGAASLATIISQAVSAALSFIRLMRINDDYRIRISEIGFSAPELKRIVSNGFPSGIQNSVINIANIVVQSNINAFGSAAVAASGIFVKLEGFAFLPITCFSLALSTCVSQNIGAGKNYRAKSAARFGITIPPLLSELLGILFLILSPKLITLFNKDPEVIRMCSDRARIECLFFCFLTISHCSAGILRGAGKAIIPMTIMLSVWCVFRVIYITLMLHIFPRIEVIYTAYPVTWTISSAIFIMYLLKADWLKEKKRSF